MEQVDTAVLDGFVQQSLEPKRIKEVVREVNAELRMKTDSSGDARSMLEAEAAEVRKELDNLIGAVARGVVSEDDAKLQVKERKAKQSKAKQSKAKQSKARCNTGPTGGNDSKTCSPHE